MNINGTKTGAHEPTPHDELAMAATRGLEQRHQRKPHDERVRQDAHRAKAAAITNAGDTGDTPNEKAADTNCHTLSVL
ncbi:hypothetical protein [Phytomonospora endophytica]|uniref:Uncharacterized protein n=1 Tax=Phytomonospora endophytica TaxID=714109 RepID=A0A841FHA6_9ACTN|nr:hypothetical protein [Phytomonospora endophytica]MBB6032477.1 hypothetical protein [Phytomonospora endophytica]